MFLGLRGKTALVAAASKGLGFAIAKELASEGASIVICARGEPALRAARDTIAHQTGATVHAVLADLSKIDEVRKVTEVALQKHGHIDILINNAGGPPAGP